MLNYINLMGRLTRDPELRYTKSQKPVVSFTLAVDRDYNGADGERQTDFIDCIAYRGTAEFVNKYFTKGSMIVVAGRLQMRDWQDRDGNKRRSVEVIAGNVYFGEHKKNDSAKAEQPRYQSQSGYQQTYGKGAFAELDDDDGDTPF